MPPSHSTLLRLHADHAEAAYRMAWLVARDESLAQDVVQELFLKVARDATSVIEANSERAMILAITRNLALDLLRRRQTHADAVDRSAREMPPWFAPATDCEMQEEQDRLVALVAALPEEQRAVIHLHLWEGFSFREIGETLGAPTQTVASRYRYGLGKLRQALKNSHCHEF